MRRCCRRFITLLLGSLIMNLPQVLGLFLQQRGWLERCVLPSCPAIFYFFCCFYRIIEIRNHAATPPPIGLAILVHPLFFADFTCPARKHLWKACNFLNQAGNKGQITLLRAGNFCFESKFEIYKKISACSFFMVNFYRNPAFRNQPLQAIMTFA